MILKYKLANRIAGIIIIFDIVLFLLLVLFSALRMMDPDEFKQAVSLLVPIRTIYLSLLIKYLLAKKSKNIMEEKVSRTYARVTYLMVTLHLLGLVAVIVVFGLGGNTNSDWMMSSIAFIETFFGIYISQVIPNLFNLKFEKEDNQSSNNGIIYRKHIFTFLGIFLKVYVSSIKKIELIGHEEIEFELNGFLVGNSQPTGEYKIEAWKKLRREGSWQSNFYLMKIYGQNLKELLGFDENLLDKDSLCCFVYNDF